MQQVIELSRTLRERKAKPLKQPLAKLIVIHPDSGLLADLEGRLRSYIVSEVSPAALQSRWELCCWPACPQRGDLARHTGRQECRQNIVPDQGTRGTHRLELLQALKQSRNSCRDPEGEQASIHMVRGLDSAWIWTTWPRVTVLHSLEARSGTLDPCCCPAWPLAGQPSCHTARCGAQPLRLEHTGFIPEFRSILHGQGAPLSDKHHPWSMTQLAAWTCCCPGLAAVMRQWECCRQAQPCKETEKE